MEIWSQMKEAALTTEAQIAEIVDGHMGGLDPEIRGQFPARETLTRCVRRWRDKQGCHYHAGILFIPTILFTFRVLKNHFHQLKDDGGEIHDLKKF